MENDMTAVPTDVGAAAAAPATAAADVGDIDQDCVEMALESLADTHEGQMAKIGANSESAASVVRHAAAAKFHRVDPIEAAAAEKILKKP